MLVTSRTTLHPTAVPPLLSRVTVAAVGVAVEVVTQVATMVTLAVVATQLEALAMASGAMESTFPDRLTPVWSVISLAQ